MKSKIISSVRLLGSGHEHKKSNFKMVSKNLIIIALITFAGFTAQAQVKNKNAKYTIEVNGNCEQCQKRIQKAALSVSGVKSAVWNVDTHQLNLMLNEEKCSLLDVEKAVTKAGHDLNSMKAPVASYEHLPACCKYDRK